MGFFFKSLPNDKILNRSEFRTLADNKINVRENLKFVLRRVQNIVGKGENAIYQCFLTKFSKGFPLKCR